MLTDRWCLVADCLSKNSKIPARQKMSNLSKLKNQMKSIRD
jgi:hypothetical protein